MGSFQSLVVWSLTFVGNLAWLRRGGPPRRLSPHESVLICGWLCRGRCGLCRRWSRGGRCGRAVNNLDVNNLHRTKWPVVPGVSGHARDLFNERDGGVVALAEDGVAAAKMSTVSDVFRNKKLRFVRVRTGVCIGETAGPVEKQVGRNLVLELISRIP